MCSLSWLSAGCFRLEGMYNSLPAFVRMFSPGNRRCRSVTIAAACEKPIRRARATTWKRISLLYRLHLISCFSVCVVIPRFECNGMIVYRFVAVRAKDTKPALLSETSIVESCAWALYLNHTLRAAEGMFLWTWLQYDCTFGFRRTC